MGCGTSKTKEIIRDRKINWQSKKDEEQEKQIQNNTQKGQFPENIEKKKNDNMLKEKNIKENIIPEKQMNKNASSLVRKNILATLDREKIKKLVLSCKKRTEISLNQFIVHFKDVTKYLTSSEKAYALFYWISENIAYDVEGYYSGNSDVEPESVYRNGYSVCSGYSQLFKLIGTNIGLDVICVLGYAKGYGYSINQQISGTNHEWNIIKIDGVYYQIDSTWGAGYLDGRYFKKEFKEFYFCPEPEQLFSSHFPEDPKWQLMTPTLSVEEFAKRVIFSPEFYQYFKKTDSIYHTIQVKKKYIIRLYKKIEKVGFLFHLYDKNEKETEDIKYLVKEKKDYIDLIYIFKHKGKYSTKIYANDDKSNVKDHLIEYYFESLEEWGEKLFEFSMDEYEIMDKLKLESLSHKNFEFKAKNIEKFFFKFKPNSGIIMDKVFLEFEGEFDYLENVTKYYMKDSNLEVEVIFNRKGKYRLIIYCLDLHSDESKKLTYYPIVESDLQEHKQFSEEEILITEPFEDSLNKIKMKNISHKNQNINANRIEKFEFECEDPDIEIEAFYYPEKSKIKKKKAKRKR